MEKPSLPAPAAKTSPYVGASARVGMRDAMASKQHVSGFMRAPATRSVRIPHLATLPAAMAGVGRQ